MTLYLTRVCQIWEYIGDDMPSVLECMNQALVKILDGLARAARPIQSARV